jgi:hypothetical protein
MLYRRRLRLVTKTTGILGLPSGGSVPCLNPSSGTRAASAPEPCFVTDSITFRRVYAQVLDPARILRPVITAHLICKAVQAHGVAWAVGRSPRHRGKRMTIRRTLLDTVLALLVALSQLTVPGGVPVVAGNLPSESDCPCCTECRCTTGGCCNHGPDSGDPQKAGTGHESQNAPSLRALATCRFPSGALHRASSGDSSTLFVTTVGRSSAADTSSSRPLQAPSFVAWDNHRSHVSPRAPPTT